MAKRRRSDEPEYEDQQTEYTSEPQPDDTPIADDQPAETQAMEESDAPAAPTTGSPQVYCVEQAGGVRGGEVYEKGQKVTMKPEEAQRLAEAGVQLSWNPDDQVQEPEPAPPEGETLPSEGDPMASPDRSQDPRHGEPMKRR